MKAYDDKKSDGKQLKSTPKDVQKNTETDLLSNNITQAMQHMGNRALHQTIQNTKLEEETTQGKFASMIQQVTQGMGEEDAPEKLEGSVMQNKSSTNPIQRTVYHSVSYVPKGDSVGAITDLHGKIKTAEEKACDLVKPNQYSVSDISAKHYNYRRDPKPATWGSLVEEELNKLTTGWNTQVTLGKSIPDYYKKVGSANLYVDLTTEGESGPGGRHITEKLDRAGGRTKGGDWEAADITHRGLNPRGSGTDVAPSYPTDFDLDQLKTFQTFKAYLNTDYEYTKEMDILKQYFGKLKETDFIKLIEKDREIFMELAAKVNFTFEEEEEDSDFDMEY